jgi:nucleoside-diphosphate-sugar epimerase
MILVTGATGFIGSHLVEALVTRGFPVRALSRRPFSAPLPAVETAVCDLITGTGIDKALEDATCVIHLAGAIKSLTTDGYYAANARATALLAGKLAGRGIRLVLVSSLAAAGPAASGRPLVEEDEPHPVSHYGRSKLEAERQLQSILPDAVIVRPPVVYGPRDRGVLPVFRSISRGWLLEIGGGDRWFSAIYVGDLVSGVIAAARNPRAAGRTYFLAHPRILTWNEFAGCAAQIMRITPRRISVPVPVARLVGASADIWSRLRRAPGILSRDKIIEAECRYWICDPGRASAEIGFEAPTMLECGLQKTLKSYREAGWLTY